MAYARLARPANIVTAMADILCGFAASGLVLPLLTHPVFNFQILDPTPLLWLLLATVGLYGGGVVFNDVFDIELDRVERPERPIPSGLASLKGAIILGMFLLFVGISAAYMVSLTSGTIALAVASLAILYDWKGKHHSFLGPVNMGACRGGNLLLGISAVPHMIQERWSLALIPIVFIAAITMISRGEVHGGSKRMLLGAVFLYAFVIGAVFFLSLASAFYIWHALPFLLLFSLLIFPPLFKAVAKPEGKLIMGAVKAGVISLIALDAAIAAGFAGWFYGLMVLLLLPVSLFLAKTFSVS